MKFSIFFPAENDPCILNGHVFIMIFIDTSSIMSNLNVDSAISMKSSDVSSVMFRLKISSSRYGSGTLQIHED